MSAICPRTSSVWRGSQGRAGFSLLELLIVLVLVGMLAALAGPPLQRTYDRVVGSGERQDVLRQLAGLPLVARSAGVALEYPEQAKDFDANLELPVGWRVIPLTPIRIERNGLCRSARLRVESESEQWDVELESPYCRVLDAN